MINYHVRSRQLLDIVNDVKNGILIISPYFQRNLVWRDIHKVDFIKTILLGFPFPEIFIANGDLDIENMINQSCIVDGQQRINSICEFISGEFDVDNKFYDDLSVDEKSQFLKYEIAIIELDIKHDDKRIIEIFKRLNRTFYSLSNIEKISSEFASSEFILVSKLICNELAYILDKDKFNNDDTDIPIDNNISPEFIDWANSTKHKKINELFFSSNIFTPYEISRQVHLNYALNIIGTIKFGFFNRNLDKEVLETYSENFDDKTYIVEHLDTVAKKILELKLVKSSMWLKKANMFSLIVAMYNNLEYISSIDSKIVKKALTDFEDNLPPEYALAAKEGVNNKKERLLRNDYIEILFKYE